MNFGNFFRNISVDKQSENVGGLFGTPSRLFESINAKTESIVSDFSHKVDLGGKIDTLKKYSSIDKIGQSVLGSTFQSKSTDEYGNENSQRDLVSKPQPPQPEKQPSMQFEKDITKTQSQITGQKEEFPSMSFERPSFEQPALKQKPTREHQTEKTNEWSTSSNQSQAFSIFSEKPANRPSYQDYSESPGYEYHPTRGYSFQNQQSQDRNAITNQASQDQIRASIFKQSVEKTDLQRTSSKQLSTGGEIETKDEYLSWKSMPKDSITHERDPFENDGYKGMSPKEPPFGSRTERESTPLAWQNQPKDSFSADAEPFRKTSIEKVTQPRQSSFSSRAEFNKDQSVCQSEKNYSTSVESLNRNESQSLASDSYSLPSQQPSISENRHENPFNKGMSLDAPETKKETSPGITPFKRQNTTPGPRPPRPPPPRSRSGSQSFQGSATVSLEEESPKQPPAVIKEESLLFEEESKEPEILMNPKKSPGSQSSSEEIGYLTRLQCQEIVSAVDDMIAEAFDETRDLEPAKSETSTFNREPSISRDYWHDSISKETEYNTTQDEQNGKESYYVTEPDDSKTATYQTDNEVPPEYQPSYEEAKSQEQYQHEQQNAETEQERSSPNVDDWYTNYEPQQRNRFEEEEEEETYPAISKEAELQKPATETEDQVKSFITNYVQVMVTGDEADLEAKNEAFKEHMLTPKGRELFSKAVELEGACSGGLLDENGLRAVLSRIVFVLTECQNTEDFVPAKRILTTSLVYHIKDPLKAGEKVFLFSYIKSQPIWHSLRFWNACFFQSVQEIRAKMMDQMKSDMEIEQAIIGQIK
ncbi:hypothetical protein Aperf_G00000082235 [Anoplocephala perfoliata]